VERIYIHTLGIIKCKKIKEREGGRGKSEGRNIINLVQLLFVDKDYLVQL
jgi:hypothetical protein